MKADRRFILLFEFLPNSVLRKGHLPIFGNLIMLNVVRLRHA